MSGLREMLPAFRRVVSAQNLEIKPTSGKEKVAGFTGDCLIGQTVTELLFLGLVANLTYYSDVHPYSASLASGLMLLFNAGSFALNRVNFRRLRSTS